MLKMPWGSCVSIIRHSPVAMCSICALYSDLDFISFSLQLDVTRLKQMDSFAMKKIQKVTCCSLNFPIFSASAFHSVAFAGPITITSRKIGGVLGVCQMLKCKLDQTFIMPFHRSIGGVLVAI